MTSQLNGVSQFQQSAIRMPESYSVGELDVLPRTIAVSILAMLDNPLEAARVCRTMRVLAHEAVAEQLVNDEISAPIVAKRWGIPVHPICLDMLRRFHVDVKSLARKEGPAACKELDLLLDNQLNLLVQPGELREFLKRRLLENSQELAEYFYGRDCLTPEPPKPFFIRPPEWLVKLYPAIVSLAATTIGSKLMPSLSCIQGDALAVQTRNVHELVDHLRSRRIVRVMPVLVVRGGDPVAIEAPSVSMRILALPPLEVIRLLGDHMHALRVEKAAFLPTGIGSLSGIKFLCIDSSSLTSLPSEIARLALKKFWIERCEGLESLSECITAIPTLQTLAVHGCSKLKQDDPVISALQARGIAVDWA